eukprot:SAG31_NODE_8918_length_1363_cov_2.069620_1_plen_147_part_00
MRAGTDKLNQAHCLHRTPQLSTAVPAASFGGPRRTSSSSRKGRLRACGVAPYATYSCSYDLQLMYVTKFSTWVGTRRHATVHARVPWYAVPSIVWPYGKSKTRAATTQRREKRFTLIIDEYELVSDVLVLRDRWWRYRVYVYIHFL